jgi:histidine ammonia-lyase
MATRADAGLRTPLSIRYAAQITGTCREALATAERVVTTALASVVDNPVIPGDDFFTNDSPLTSGQQLGETLHALSTALASLAVAGERRMALLLTPNIGSGLPPFLVHPDVEGGLNSGPVIAQYTAASLVAELRTRSAPASLQSIPTGAGTEDHVSMCWLAAAHTTWAIDTVEMVLALELIVSLQAIDVSGRPVPKGLAPLYEAVRAVVPVTTEDRVIGDDCARVLAVLRG